MVAVENVDGVNSFVDSVADPVFTSAGSPHSLEGRPQGGANQPGTFPQRSVDELPGGY